MSQTETTTTTTSVSEEATKNHNTNNNTSPTTNIAQVAPQQDNSSSKHKKEKGKKVVDPEYVKSPLSTQQAVAADNRPASTTTSRNAGSSSSRSGRSVKPFQKGGFLSLLLCCTVGSGSFLDNSDKSSFANSKKTQLQQQTNRNSRASSKEKQPNVDKVIQPNTTITNTAIIPPAIITNPADLNHLSTTNNNNTNNNNNASENETSADNATGNIESTSPISLPPQTSPVGPVVWLLPPLANEDKERKCLVLDLDETLVHSSFKIIPNPDFIVPVEIDNQYHNVYVLKRPGVDEFMRKMGEKYEIVVFTASLAKYADPVLDMLDIHRVVKHRLFRESCFNHKGTYVKDLSQLGRDLASTLILDNSPASYIFHTSNAVPVSTWFNDPHDTELTDLVAFLEDLTVVDDVQLVLDNMIDPNIIVSSSA